MEKHTGPTPDASPLKFRINLLLKVYKHRY
jgi:hypothetical protein